jgi:CHASE1-domain containing sensor protein
LGASIVSASVAVIVVTTAIILAFPDYAAATSDSRREERYACLSRPAFTALAARSPARIMAPVDLGSQLLLYTRHSVVGAPYHRNGEGVRDTFRFFNEPLEESRSILKSRGITLVVICPALKEITGLVDYTPDSFVALFAADSLPAWLHEETPPDSPLRIYSVEP